MTKSQSHQALFVLWILLLRVTANGSVNVIAGIAVILQFAMALVHLVLWQRELRKELK